MPESATAKWDLVYREHGDIWGREPSSVLCKVLSSFLPKPGFVLDFGCGSGRNAIHLASLGWRVDAIDHSQQALRIAGSMTPECLSPMVTYRQGVAACHREHYDLIICLGVIHGFSLTEARLLIRSLRMIVRSGGYMLVSFFCGCSRCHKGYRQKTLVCGSQSFPVWMYTPQEFASWVVPDSVSVMKHGVSLDQHEPEVEHCHNVVHLLVRSNHICHELD